MQNVSISSPGKIWVNPRFYGCRQKFTNFVFFWHLNCFLLYVMRSFPSREGRKKSRVKHVTENALDIIIWHYHSLAMMSSHFHIISPCLEELVSFNEICLFKNTTQTGRPYMVWFCLYKMCVNDFIYMKKLHTKWFPLIWNNRQICRDRK